MGNQQKLTPVQGYFDPNIDKEEVVITTSIPNNSRLTYTKAEISLNKERPKMILNPNVEVRDKMLKQIDLLDGKCPCIESQDDSECPCDVFIHQGKCEYGLFIEKEK